MTALSNNTRVVVIANPHNPSSQLLSEDVLREIGAAAEHVGARVIVDEVYLDAVFDRDWLPCVHLGPAFISTSSLTKVYGLSALRCGWLIADEAFARRAWRLADLYGNVQPFAPDWLATRAFEHLAALRMRSQHILDANRATFQQWILSRSDVSYLASEWGTTVCVRPERVNVRTLCETLRTQYDVSVVPGDFFELPDFIRIGLSVSPAVFREGLTRLDACLNQLSRG
jgi:aspartate/methionine/tyrosine aminotransferase